jgi:hypothetical protein
MTVSNSDYIAFIELTIVKRECERMWNKTVVTEFKIQTRIFLMELKKITKICHDSF